MKKAYIMIVDDEADILELARYNLEREGYQVSCLNSGEDAVESVKEIKPDLVLLDLMLPGMDGYEICKLLKRDENTQYIPIIMLTAKGEESDIVTGLELGADDYITKPFSPKVLIARLRTVLRRSNRREEQKSAVISKHNITINTARFEVTVNDQPVDLTATEFHILNFIIRHPGWVFTRSQIIDGVKGTDYPVTDRSVDVQIVGLRKKLGEAGQYIETVRGIGYRMKDEDSNAL